MARKIAKIYGTVRIPKKRKTFKQRFWKKRKDGIRQRYWKKITKQVGKEKKQYIEKYTGGKTVAELAENVTKLAEQYEWIDYNEMIEEYV